MSGTELTRNLYPFSRKGNSVIMVVYVWLLPMLFSMPSAYPPFWPILNIFARSSQPLLPVK